MNMRISNVNTVPTADERSSGVGVLRLIDDRIRWLLSSVSTAHGGRCLLKHRRKPLG